MKKDLICILAQAFYGNKTATEIRRDEIDGFICGYADKAVNEGREVVYLPNEKNLVIIYNRREEEKRRKENIRYYEEDGYAAKPLAIISEQNFEIYSRCIGCRISDSGEIESLHEEDYAKYEPYFKD